MKNGWKWFLAGLATILVLGLVLVGIASFGGWPMGYNHMGYWDGRSSGFFFFPWMMLGMGIFPLLVIVLIVVGIVGLIRGLTPGQPHPGSFSKNCPNCGRGVQTDWAHCPYCGNSLTQ